jgi:hypothetical protein
VASGWPADRRAVVPDGLDIEGANQMAPLTHADVVDAAVAARLERQHPALEPRCD